MSLAISLGASAVGSTIMHEVLPWRTLCVAMAASPARVPAVHRAPGCLMGLMVITDIDDTIKSSGGVELAGIPLGGVDTSFERGSFYPGVFDFAAELACAAAGLGGTPLPVAVLTARAEEFRAFLEIRQSDKLCVGFRNAGAARGYPEWGVGPVLYGSVNEWINQDRKGWRKFENFKLLREGKDGGSSSSGGGGRKVRRRYVFVGDNGRSEKDLEAAQRIIDAFPADLDAVLLHAVSGEVQPAPLPDDFEYGGVPVRYFRTYASAAATANELGLLSNAAALRVLDATEADLAADATNVSPGSANERLLLTEIEEARERIGGLPIDKPLGPIRRPLRRLQLLSRLRRAAGAISQRE